MLCLVSVPNFSGIAGYSGSESHLRNRDQMGTALESTDAKNKLEDLSGIQVKPGENPYEALIRACRNDPVCPGTVWLPSSARITDGMASIQAEIQSLYSAHRIRRNEQQKDKFLSGDFTELVIDPFLLRIERPELEPGFQDPRNCLVFWARPPDHAVRLATHLQNLLKKAAPSKSPQSLQAV